MRTTELTDIERAYELIVQVLSRVGQEGEYLALGPENEHPGDATQSTVQKRLVIRKGLQSTKDLLGIALQLMSPVEPRSSREFSALKRDMLQDLRSAARRTYEAGHLLIGVDLRE